MKVDSKRHHNAFNGTKKYRSDRMRVFNPKDAELLIQRYGIVEKKKIPLSLQADSGARRLRYARDRYLPAEHGAWLSIPLFRFGGNSSRQTRGGCQDQAQGWG